MKVSNKGIVEIAAHEGIVPAPYRDSVGVVTFGIGHTAAAGGLDPREMNSAMPTGDALTAAIDRAINIFKDDLRKYEARVNDAIKVPLEQYEFDALVSFDLNTGGIYRAKLTQEINTGDKSGAGFMGWLKPPEIKERRTKEMQLFRTGRYSAGKVPIWKTNGALKLVGMSGTISAQGILDRMGSASQPTPPNTPTGFTALLKLIMGLFK